MFGIITAGDFLKKARDDVTALEAEIANAGLAINCALSLYHVHEWLWAKHLKAKTPIKLDGVLVRKKEDFVAWCDVHIPHFKLVQELANGSKHLAPTASIGSTRTVEGYGVGPYGIGPYGMSYLLVDLGEASGDDRWMVGHTIMAEIADAWTKFFAAHGVS